QQSRIARPERRLRPGRVPVLLERHHQRRRRHGREDAAEGRHAEPEWLRSGGARVSPGKETQLVLSATMSALKVIGFVILAAILAAAIGAWRWGLPLRAETSAGASAGVDALQKAKVLERLIERTASRSKAGAAPGFVLDPAWPKVLPHNWVMGDVGGI